MITVSKEIKEDANRLNDFQEITWLNEIRESAQSRKMEFNKATEILKNN